MEDTTMRHQGRRRLSPQPDGTGRPAPISVTDQSDPNNVHALPGECLVPDQQVPLPAITALLQRVRTWVETAFARAGAADDPYHGAAHAREVERRAVAIDDQFANHVCRAERLALRLAALLHDVGYAAYLPEWSRDRREHVAASLAFAMSKLPNEPLLARNPELLPAIYYLIAHHDDTNYAFPSQVWDGCVRPADLDDHVAYLGEYADHLSEGQRQRLDLLLAILREADALTATGTAGAERTFTYSTSRGLPAFAPGNPLNAWCWEESATGNVRVAAKRALLDAFTDEGKKAARESYQHMERYVERICHQGDIPYHPESLSWRDVLGESDSAARPSVTLRRYVGWPSLEQTLRDVRLRGDRTLQPYADAHIAARRLRIADLRPMSSYALASRIEQLATLQTCLEERYALSLFDLTGIVEFQQDGAGVRMAPPIVERYREPAEGAEAAVIVDGLHRVLLARARGLECIWAVEIRDVPSRFPLVAFPLRWDEVNVVEAVPTTGAKRRFRYPRFADFPDISGFSAVQPTEADYLYFFYRDLAPLGSTGIRLAKQPDGRER